MSECKGLYCEKHVRWCPDGVCADCAPAEPFAFWRAGPPQPMAPGDLQRQMNALWVKMGERTTDRDLTAEQAAYGGKFWGITGHESWVKRCAAMPPVVGRPCDHAAGYCKDTAHKYEPVADPEE